MQLWHKQKCNGMTKSKMSFTVSMQY